MRVPALAAVTMLTLAAAMAERVLAQEIPTENLLSLDSLLNIPVRAASRYEQTTKEAPASITVITREDIVTSGFVTLGEVLGSLQGFYTTYDRSFLSVGVRGFGPSGSNNNRILLLFDGVRQNDIFAGATPMGSEFNHALDVVERIEIVRGPGSALYGSSAVFAVVNVVTRAGASMDGGLARVELGSFGLKSGTVAYGKALPGGADLLVQGSWLDADGQDLYFPEYDNPATGSGVARGLDTETVYALWGRLRVSDFSFLVTGGGREKSDPTAPFGASFGDRSSQDSDSYFVQGTWDKAFSPRVAATVSAYQTGAWVVGSYAYDEPQPDRVLDATGDMQGLDAQLRLDASPSNRIIIGTELIRWNSEFFISSVLSNGRDVGGAKSVASLYGQNEWQAREDLAVVLGLRLDRHRYAGSSVSPRAGLVFHPGGSTTLKLLYGEAFRAPTVLEQFIEEPPVLLANQALGPEEIQTVELVWEQRLTSDLHSTVSFYHYDMDGLIGQALDPERGGLTFQNLGKAHSAGVEMGLNGVSGRTSYYLTYNYQDADNRETQQRLENSPKHLARAGIRVRSRGGVLFGVHSSYDGARMTPQGSETDAFTLVGASLVLPLVGPLQASLRVWNLFDTEYRTPATPTHRQAGLTQDGRTFRVRLSARF